MTLMNCARFLLFVSFVFWADVLEAASLQVAPVRINVPSGAAASKIMLRNVGSELINAQARVFRWTLANGKEELVETWDVVASPPFVKLGPGVETVVRIVRTSKRPISGEEAYRLIIDEIPPAPDKAGLSISFVLRQSIPVFFGGASDEPAILAWQVENRKGKVFVTAINSGDKHARISSLKISTKAGLAVSFGKGLTGYVLGRSTARFAAKGKLKGIAPGSKIFVTADTNNGPIQTAANLRVAD